MKRRMENGSVLSLVIVLLVLVTMVLIVLTESSNTMLFQADKAYLRAVERNLTASGLAWAQLHTADANEPLPLDVAFLSTRPAGLTVRTIETNDRQATVHIATSCTKARQTLDTSQDYVISLP
ncbi:MAG: hypothetical protein JW741_30070 [Sedimentisphaerales bacterium]|nr:hypothetical protein [Sedimentisphaerales bacterium]